MPSLVDDLDRSLSWRKYELSTLFLQAKSNTDKIQESLLRACIVMLYAHWEGFIKDATRIYIDNINKQKINLEDLSHRLARLAFSKDIEEFPKHKKYKTYGDCYGKIINCRKTYKKLTNEIDVKSNLTSKIFKDILYLIDDDENKYKDFFEYIDKVVDARNAISHGRQLKSGIATIIEFDEVHKKINDAIEIFKNAIINNFESQRFKI